MLRRLPLTVALLALALFASAAPAEAAKRKVPYGFLGTVLNNSQANGLSDAGLDAQAASMARSGVESVRYTFTWSEMEPARGRYNFSRYDRVVAAAARHGIEVLPIVISTPRWASSRPRAARPYLYAPKSSSTYASFLRTLIRRYGTRGSFWRASGTPKVAIKSWQIWNEPAADFFWATRPWPRSYTRMLKVAYRTAKKTDRNARIVLGSIAGVTRSTPWAQIRALYKQGARKYFDAVSLHFFSSAPTVRSTAAQTVKIAKLVRKEMRRAKDRKKSIWFTELTWTAAQGQLPRGDLFGFETTPRGQAARLSGVFGRLARDRKKLGIGRLYWYNWASEYVPQFVTGGPGALTFQYSGLNKLTGTTITPLPLLRTYAALAARYQGCRKSDNAKRCR